MYYGTFGVNRALGKFYVALDAKDEDQARDMLNETFGQKWSFLYGDEEKIDALDQFQLVKVFTIREDPLNGQYRVEM